MLLQKSKPYIQGGSMSEIIETTPKMNLTPQDLDDLLEQVHEYHTIYKPLFQRREQREKSKRYLYGLLSPEIKNKAIEPMMLELEGDNENEIRAMQHFVSKGAWRDGTILARHWQEVGKDLGDEEGVYTVDGSDFAKQGPESAGVKRQRCGELGKIANCQAGVFVGYVSSKGYTLLHRRLYLPEEWVKDEAFAERRQKCGVPEQVTFQTKPTSGVEMMKEIRQQGTLPGRWLTCDEAFGQSPAFLDQIADLDLWYYAEVPHTTRVWRDRPATYVPEWSGRGRKPTVARLVDDAPDPQTVADMAASIPAEQWSRHTIKEGSKGPMVADFAFLRVVAVRDGLPGPDVWLIFRRALSTGELKVYLSNAPQETSHDTLVRISGMRWPIETSFEDGKQLVGMGDYQVRSWTGWHHHMTMCILAHFFLVRLQLRLADKAPALTLPQAKLLLTGVLPKREFDSEWVLEVLGYRQRRNHAAYLSHRKRRLDMLHQLEQ
jgi:SRSO17 transposase